MARSARDHQRTRPVHCPQARVHGVQPRLQRGRHGLPAFRHPAGPRNQPDVVQHLLQAAAEQHHNWHVDPCHGFDQLVGRLPGWGDDDEVRPKSGDGIDRKSKPPPDLGQPRHIGRVAGELFYSHDAACQAEGDHQLGVGREDGDDALRRLWQDHIALQCVAQADGARRRRLRINRRRRRSTGQQRGQAPHAHGHGSAAAAAVQASSDPIRQRCIHETLRSPLAVRPSGRVQASTYRSHHSGSGHRQCTAPGPAR